MQHSISNEPQCLYYSGESFSHPYPNLNSFAYAFNDEFEKLLLSRCDYLMKTDIDVFISPAALTWIPSRKLIAGRGAYCTAFNRQRLKKIAARMGFRHQNIHCLLYFSE